MENFNYSRRERPFHRITNFIWNALTLIMLLGVVCVVATFLVVFAKPDIAINPFKPPVLPTPVAMPTYTVTPRSILPPTWTPLPSLEPTSTSTLQPTNTSAPQPTNTLAPTSTPFNLLTPTLTSTVSSARGTPFEVSQGTPVSTSSLAFYPERKCDWMGVAGQVFDLSGAPISGQQVRLGGFLSGKAVDILTLTGLSSAYGTAGFYEFTLADKPIASNKSLWLQLVDQAGLAMSEKIFFETSDSCDKNLIFVNFRQVR
jgi:hypothetical protein